MAESLLPDTDAISAGVLEWTEYRNKWLVRYKSPVFPYEVKRTHTADWKEADAAFEIYMADLKEKTKAWRDANHAVMPALPQTD